MSILYSIIVSSHLLLYFWHPTNVENQQRCVIFAMWYTHWLAHVSSVGDIFSKRWKKERKRAYLAEMSILPPCLTDFKIWLPEDRKVQRRDMGGTIQDLLPVWEAQRKVLRLSFQPQTDVAVSVHLIRPVMLQPVGRTQILDRAEVSDSWTELRSFGPAHNSFWPHGFRCFASAYAIISTFFSSHCIRRQHMQSYFFD